MRRSKRVVEFTTGPGSRGPITPPSGRASPSEALLPIPQIFLAFCPLLVDTKHGHLRLFLPSVTVVDPVSAAPHQITNVQCDFVKPGVLLHEGFSFPSEITMKSLSTGKVAAITGMSIRMVIKWIDSGILKSWKVPGSRFRRVESSTLRKFMIDHNLPLETLDEHLGVVLVISADPELQKEIAHANLNGRQISVGSLFEAGLSWSQITPTIVIVDLALGEESVRKGLASLQSKTPAPHLIAVAHGNEAVPATTSVVHRSEIARVLPKLVERLL